MKPVLLPEEVILELLESEEDVLQPRVTQGPKLCPTCGGVFTPVAGRLNAIMLECMACGTKMSPETGLITELGVVSRTMEPEVRMLSYPSNLKVPDSKSRQT